MLQKPTNDDLASCKSIYNDCQLNHLETGYKLYIKNCGGCHTLHLPNTYNKQQWEKKLPEMFEKTSLNESEKFLVQKYLYSVCNKL